MTDTDAEREENYPSEPMRTNSPNYGQMALGAAVTLLIGFLFQNFIGKPIDRADALNEQRIATLEKFAEASRDDRNLLHTQVGALDMKTAQLSRLREDDRAEYKQGQAEIKAELAEIKDILDERSKMVKPRRTQ